MVRNSRKTRDNTTPTEITGAAAAADLHVRLLLLSQTGRALPRVRDMLPDDAGGSALREMRRGGVRCLWNAIMSRSLMLGRGITGQRVNDPGKCVFAYRTWKRCCLYQLDQQVGNRISL